MAIYADKCRPVFAGASISQGTHQGPGTLGCFVLNKQGKICLLSNYHVLQRNFDVEKDDKLGTKKDDIVQPAAGWVAEWGQKKKFKPEYFIAKFTNGILKDHMDAGVAQLNKGIAWKNKTKDGQVIKAPATTPVQNGDRVWKWGCASGAQVWGTVTNAKTDKDAEIIHLGTKFKFKNQIEVTIEDESKNGGMFQHPGDSGSVLCNEAGNIVGLMHGGGQGKSALAIPIQAVMGFLEIKFPTQAEGTAS